MSQVVHSVVIDLDTQQEYDDTRARLLAAGFTITSENGTSHIEATKTESS